MVDPDQPEIVGYELRGGVYLETGRYQGEQPVTFPVGPTDVTLIPAQLAG